MQSSGEAFHSVLRSISAVLRQLIALLMPDLAYRIRLHLGQALTTQRFDDTLGGLRDPVDLWLRSDRRLEPNATA